MTTINDCAYQRPLMSPTHVYMDFMKTRVSFNHNQPLLIEALMCIKSPYDAKPVSTVHLRDDPFIRCYSCCAPGGLEDARRAVPALDGGRVFSSRIVLQRFSTQLDVVTAVAVWDAEFTRNA